jgi:translation initiation factor 3 subunit C
VQETVEEYDDMVEREPEEKDGKLVKVEIAGNLISLVENIDNEVSSDQKREGRGADVVVHQDAATYRCAREELGLYRAAERGGAALCDDHQGAGIV